MNNTLYLMQNVPQSNQLNPAIQPECKVFLGFPGLSSIYVNYANNGFTYNDIIKDGTGLQKDSLVVDINSFHDALQSTNTIVNQLDYTFFSLGIRAKKMFFTLDMSSKIDTRLGFDKGLISFLKNGNAGYMGRTANLGAIGLDGTAYNEVALGVSKQVTEKLTVGVKAKMLFGVANMHMDQSNLSVYTSESGDLVRLHSKQLMKVSMPLDVTQDADGYIDDIDVLDDDLDATFFSGTNNKGFAFDLGATYQFDEKTTFYASILDIGGIKWNDTYELSQDATFDWQGGDWSQSGNSNDPNYREIEDVMEDLTDSISDAFRFKDKAGSYSKALPTKIYLGGSYKLNERVNVGAVSRTEIYNGKLRPSLSLSANTRVIRNFSASVSYSMVNNSYNNVGAGIAAKLGPFQIYAVSDNILAMNPNTAKTANFRFGMNMMFGCRKKTVKKDVCKIQEDLILEHMEKVKEQNKKEMEE
ncbi:hypothetical protein DWB61_01220 [Ancylomarina euxinus]|uniref:DUF5723 domain-containing protein n=1 Tax=Ancylomarina euxinus TaxID=2283627 RepID=A0A425Y7W3_9BACT|nr:DUF5723 family protein [Ancylomarina euxinus]MCZ4693467.1 DUF5723 family protein [Ancylomarina euxinus]MUP13694.1 hypothetical protein [Ancylomarina euxinus]RRG24665.1 hypothetical protein DWB61_01220 [Ancylomarina euxinus]